MKDINYALRKAYFDALSGITDVPVYYQCLPNNAAPESYIVYRSIQSTDASTKNSSDTFTNITVEIHTYTDIVNSGLSADEIADEVYSRIYAFTQDVLELDGVQMVNTKATNDVTQNFIMQSNRQYISRYITFRHYIFQNIDNS